MFKKVKKLIMIDDTKHKCKKCGKPSEVKVIVKGGNTKRFCLCDDCFYNIFKKAVEEFRR